MNFFTISEPVYNIQIGFQTPVSPIAEGIFAFHDDLMIFISGILFFVGYLMYACLVQYAKPAAGSQTKGNNMPHHFVHAPVLEIIWTIIPALILVIIAIPSFSLLYSIDEVVEPFFTIKVVGHQWYWTYEFFDPEVVTRLYNEVLSKHTLVYESETSGSFDSYMLGDAEVQAKEGLTRFRLLTVDNHLFLPTNLHVRALVTSADVLHSWTVPSLGFKLDACPGRLNQTSLFIKRPGIYYGQCSELCGVNHGFRPIGIVSQNFFVGLNPAKFDLEPAMSALQSLVIELFILIDFIYI